MLILENILSKTFISSSSKLDGKRPTDIGLLGAMQEAAQTAEFAESKGVGLLGKILEPLYDEDIVEDEHMLEWAEKHASTEAQQASAKFITWLQEASEEESSDEDE